MSVGRPRPEPPSRTFRGPNRVRKVTYSLPAPLVGELERRSRLAGRPKSGLIAEALARFFEERDRDDLGRIYREAARDPRFVGDNRAILHDFSSLDREASKRR